MKLFSHRRLCFLLACLLCNLSLAADQLAKVISQAERQQILEKVQKKVITKEAFQKGQYDSVPSLFHGSGSGMQGAKLVEDVEHLSDVEFLNLIIKEKVPKGIIRLEGQDYLSFAFGPVKAGGGFKGKYGTRSYVIRVLSIDKHSYTFQYNNEVQVVPFETSKGKLTKSP